MHVEIDQSGRLERLNTPTVIAAANGKWQAVLLTIPVKKEIIYWFRTSTIKHKDQAAILFAVIIYLLIKDFPFNTVIVIDEEYSGKNLLINETIQELLRNDLRGLNFNLIFNRIGKHSPAHELSWSLHRFKIWKGLSGKKISTNEVLNLLKKLSCRHHSPSLRRGSACT